MYDLELEKIISYIKKNKLKEIVLQFPDGLKQKAEGIAREIERRTNAEAHIYFGSCFGGCDIPFGLDILGIELVIQWGHAKFNKENW